MTFGIKLHFNRGFLSTEYTKIIHFYGRKEENGSREMDSFMFSIIFSWQLICDFNIILLTRAQACVCVCVCARACVCVCVRARKMCFVACTTRCSSV